MPDAAHSVQWRAFVEELGRAVYVRRTDLGMSQEMLAYTAGLSRSAVQKLERGQGRPNAASNPSLRVILAVAQVLDLPLEQLMPTPPDLTNRLR